MYGPPAGPVDFAAEMSERDDRFSLDVPIPGDGVTAIDALVAATSLPRQRIKHAMACGAVWLSSGGRRAARLRRATSS